MAEYFAQVAESRVEVLNQLYNFQLEVVNCVSCPLHKEVKSPVPGQLVLLSDFLFVGLAPGRNGAEKTGIPFTKDKSGRLFRKMISILEEKGLTVSVTNIVKCNPLDKNKNNRNPTPFEIRQCSLHLEREIELVRPKMIIILGKVTEKFLNISHESATTDTIEINLSKNKIPTMTIFHPSAIANYHKMSESEYQSIFSDIADIYKNFYKEGLDQKRLPIDSDDDLKKKKENVPEAMRKMIEWS